MSANQKARAGRLYLAAILAMGLTMGTALAAKQDTLVWAMEQEVSVADPYYAMSRAVVILTDEVCDSLLHKNVDTGTYGPHIASTYKWVDDLTLEMTLRDDVVFHGGKKLSAADVKYTFEHIASPDSGVLAASHFNWIKSVEVDSPTEIRIHLQRPFPMALEYLSSATPILPVGHYENAPIRSGKKDYGSVPVDCTGPYKITNIRAGESIDMQANESYFGGGKGFPSIKNLSFRTIIDPDAQIVEILGGNVHWIWDLRPEKAAGLKRMKQVQVVQAPIQRFSYVSMDASGKFKPNPFEDIRVRQAVNHAINREMISKNLVGEASEVLNTSCYPKQFGCHIDVEAYPYDPEKARSLLAEAGFKDGFSTDIYAYRERELTEAIINDLRAVGIKANLRFMQYNALRPLLRSGEASLAFLSWGSFGLGDSSASTSYFFSGGPDDLARDLEVEKYLKLADTSVDPTVRNENYKKAQERIADQAYWAPMFTLVRYYAFSDRLDSRAYFDDLPRFYAARWK